MHLCPLFLGHNFQCASSVLPFCQCRHHGRKAHPSFQSTVAEVPPALPENLGRTSTRTSQVEGSGEIGPLKKIKFEICRSLLFNSALSPCQSPKKVLIFTLKREGAFFPKSKPGISQKVCGASHFQTENRLSLSYIDP